MSKPLRGTAAAPVVAAAVLLFHAASALAATRTVVIEGMKFNPPELEAKAGDTVVWKNNDIVPHTATSDTKAFDSGGILQGKSFKTRLRKKGEYPYSCLYHPTMKARITVK